ncbi:YihY/virulence factor BrkB family protein [Frankia sp. AiPs1]|uniref:YihY/virulence factor BrkB family protein n=1 Tax=Frankia sp. AiPs1 TaxID=573493 RepID=UPI0020434D72|nr:YihY/virulence factor BrkB family protein [Frankia sp. AiPs1]MCM3924776.1 YihY/virulence factor BrkB family protein [Frankia sp. AiPs1]
MTRPREAVRAGVGTVSDTASAVRAKRPFIDHIIRAYSRYTTDGGDRLAASATYFAFLSFFPIVALAFAVTGFVVDAYPDAQDSLTKQINDYLPGLSDRLDVTSIGNAKVGVGIIGVLGLLLAGLAWIDALRDALRLVWHQDIDVGNIIMRRLRDITVLAGLGLTLLASLVVTSLSTSATGTFLDWIGLSGSTAAAWVTGIFALLVALAIDTAVFLYLFWRLPGQTDRTRSARGAVLGAVGLEILKVVGTWLVGKTTGNPVYGTFAVIVGLLIWINIVMRWTLFVAAWTVTAPYDSDVYPSGTAGPPAVHPPYGSPDRDASRPAAEPHGADSPSARGAAPPDDLSVRLVSKRSESSSTTPYSSVSVGSAATGSDATLAARLRASLRRRHPSETSGGSG